MKQSLFEKIKSEVGVKEVISTFYMEPDKYNKVKCPFHNDSNASLSIDVDNNRWKCFGCGKGGDIIDFVSELKGIDCLTATKLIADTFHIEYEWTTNSVKTYIRNCKKDVTKTKYFLSRGLNVETIGKFNLGYDEKRKVVTIPYDKSLNYYQSRSVDDKRYYKQKTDQSAVEPIFNGSILKGNKIIFVVESPICAMSIAQCGYDAVATCGVTCWKKVADKLKSFYGSTSAILCFDNDEAGRKASKEMQTYLQGYKIPCMEFNVAGKYKDPNELLVANESQLRDNLQEAIKLSQEAKLKGQDSFSALDLLGADIPPLEWIIDDFLPVGLASLNGQPKSKKSWMALQMCVDIAQGKPFMGFNTHKHEVLYYALEDGKARLQTRLKKILKSNEGMENLHFQINTTEMDMGLFEQMERELELHPGIKLIIIDTLQMIRGELLKCKTLYGNEYGDCKILKRFADSHNICLMYIHHTRKDSKDYFDDEDDNDGFDDVSGTTAMTGGPDTNFLLAVNRKNCNEAKFKFKCRDMQKERLALNFNEDTLRWENLGNFTAYKIKKQDEIYNNDKFVKTIKHLVETSKGHCWKGTTTEFIEETKKFTGLDVNEHPTTVGRLITGFKGKLLKDKIEHKTYKSKERGHIFTRI